MLNGAVSFMGIGAQAQQPFHPPPVRLTIDSPLEAILGEPWSRAVLEKDLPALTAHARFATLKTMSLRQIAPNSHGFVSDADLARVGNDLAARPGRIVNDR